MYGLAQGMVMRTSQQGLALIAAGWVRIRILYFNLRSI